MSLHESDYISLAETYGPELIELIVKYGPNFEKFIINTTADTIGLIKK